MNSVIDPSYKGEIRFPQSGIGKQLEIGNKVAKFNGVKWPWRINMFDGYLVTCFHGNSRDNKIGCLTDSMSLTASDDVVSAIDPIHIYRSKNKCTNYIINMDIISQMISLAINR